jgi:4-carboxymuconolactone decarboxylase
MPRLKQPPQSFEDFVRRYPKLGRAWDLLGEAAAEAGPLDAKTQRLVKLGLAIAAKQEGAVHSAVRKALAAGAAAEELEQVVALAASLIGMPATVMVFQWVKEEVAGTRG